MQINLEIRYLVLLDIICLNLPAESLLEIDTVCARYWMTCLVLTICNGSYWYFDIRYLQLLQFQFIFR